MTTPDSPFGPGAEFELIRRLTGRSGTLSAEVRVGPGDDAAVLEGGWVVSTDLSVEDVHFRRARVEETEIGYRAATAALSDMAAMGAAPVGLLVSIAAPRGGAVDVEAVQAGIVAAADVVGGSVIGGDLSRSPGPLMIDIVALGRTEWPVLRSGAEAGDHVWVTGELGAAAAAVHVWEGGDVPSEPLRSAFTRPVARVREAQCLVEHELVDAMIDVSDGLVGDVGHIAASSGVRITLDLADIPVAPAARGLLGEADALEAALYGGEDYELCFVTDPETVDPEYFLDRYGVTVTRIGVVTEGAGVWLRSADGAVAPARSSGFDHWEPTGTSDEDPT